MLSPRRDIVLNLAVLLAISGCAGQGRVGGFGKGVGKDGRSIKKLAPSVSTPVP